jgi:hypothetical protein
MVALLLPPLFASSCLTFEPSHAAIKIIFSLSYCWQSTDTTCAHVLLPRRRLWPRVTRLSLVSLSVMVCGQVAGMAIMALSLMAFQL